MRRWAINLFCLFSLLIFSTSVAIWVRSFFVSEWISYYRPAGGAAQRPGATPTAMTSLGWDWGVIILARMVIETPPGAPYPQGWNHLMAGASANGIIPRAPKDKVNLQFAGFILVYTDALGGVPGRFYAGVWVPLWIFLPAAIPPWIGLRRWKNRRRRGFAVSQNSLLNTEVTETTEKN